MMKKGGGEGLRRGLWSEEEDKILMEHIKIHGKGRWNRIAKITGLKRCGKSCRLRWMNYLCPEIKRDAFSDEEDDLIIRLHKLLGNRWSLIAGRVPGRTDNQVKNHWNTHLKKKLGTIKKHDTTATTTSSNINLVGSSSPLQSIKIAESVTFETPVEESNNVVTCSETAMMINSATSQDTTEDDHHNKLLYSNDEPMISDDFESSFWLWSNYNGDLIQGRQPSVMELLIDPLDCFVQDYSI